eukprot:CAMPEP_0113717884 /NCGR_PEP_ID=MMETSP0038_2-20120614/34833_1 /TAXON_ID=2898 /ORGANISM="Cryptomonas paramecium" /LENGTH=109 /DNA_ID=CAMNT_0000645847 /DNA_START=50 /DNA_END=376 /DNA_ORIENTATION=+ /assembly_acc=CAM_ASM_000170
MTSKEETNDFREYKVGDAVEAMWIADGGWYPGTIEDILDGNNYDVRWVDNQGLAETQVTSSRHIRLFDAARYYSFGEHVLAQDDLHSAYLTFRCLMMLKKDFEDTEIIY